MLLNFVLAVILTSAQLYTWSKLSGKKIEILSVKTILSVIIISIFSVANFLNINPFIKPTTMIIAAMFCCKILLNCDVKRTIIIVFFNYFIIIIAEAIFGSLLVLISNSNLKYLLDNYSGSILANLTISFLVVILVNLKIIQKLYKFIIKYTTNLKNYETLLYLSILIACSIFDFALTYFTNNIFIALVLNTIITFIYTVIVFKLIKAKNNYIIINSKYNTSLDSLQAQESIIEDYRVINHENKNQLLTIKSMTKNKKVIGYIDSLLHQKETFDNEVIDATLKLPEGGIKGLIYQKIMYMKNKDIHCYLNIDKNITPKLLANISNNDTVDLCQILGVLIDNAIDATLDLDKRVININLWVSQNILNISISNNYNKNISFKRNSTYLKTTKGKGHGYGLKLVDKIVYGNSKLKNTRQITKETFIQNVCMNLET